MHIPVLLKEMMDYLNPQPNQNFVDATLGFGGHTAAILEAIKPTGRVLGIEKDPEVYKIIKQNAKEPGLIAVNSSYLNLKEIVKNCRFGPIKGIVFDLGFSTWHIEKSGRGFSFQKNEPLEMRFNPAGESALTAAEIVNNWPEEEIAKILKDYGEEKFAFRIARAITEARKIKTLKTTFDLLGVIGRAVPKRFQKSKIHPATRTFQALRIAVNDELEDLKTALAQAVELLDKGGRLVVISFHSLEDRIVKRFFKSMAQENILKILTKKPIIASAEELKENPKARSAKLRATEKV